MKLSQELKIKAKQIKKYQKNTIPYKDALLTLMQIQHMLAKQYGYKNWNDLLKKEENKNEN